MLRTPIAKGKAQIKTELENSMATQERPARRKTGRSDMPMIDPRTGLWTPKITVGRVS